MIRKTSIALNQLPDKTPASLRRLSDPDLYTFIAGWKEGSADWIAGQVELRRRENLTARQALWVSVISLILSIITLVATGIVNTEG